MERLVSNLRQFEAGARVNVRRSGPGPARRSTRTELLDGDLGRTLAKVADGAARCFLAARVRDEIGLSAARRC